MIKTFQVWLVCGIKYFRQNGIEQVSKMQLSAECCNTDDRSEFMMCFLFTAKKNLHRQPLITHLNRSSL